jgi:peptidylprolyl isomerase
MLLNVLMVLKVLLFALLAVLAPAAPAAAAEWPGEFDPAPWQTTEAGIEVQDREVGDGAVVEVGAELQVHYYGMLEDGTVFDASRDRGSAFGFRVGDHQVIRGWEDGLLGMRVGGRRRLVIPAALGYGDRGAGPIPPNSTLYFEIELLGLKPPRRPPAAPSEVPAEALQPVKDAEGVRYADVTEGDGRRVRPGARVCVDWASWKGGEAAEHTYMRNGCTWYRLDDGDAPPLLDAALVRMRAGGRRQVVGPGDPPLVYEVELQATGK